MQSRSPAWARGGAGGRARTAEGRPQPENPAAWVELKVLRMGAAARYRPGWRPASESRWTRRIRYLLGLHGRGHPPHSWRRPTSWPGAARVVPACAPPGAWGPSTHRPSTSGRAPCGLGRENARSSAETSNDRHQGARRAPARPWRTVAGGGRTLSRWRSSTRISAICGVVRRWDSGRRWERVGFARCKTESSTPQEWATLSRWGWGQGRSLGGSSVLGPGLALINPAPSKHWSEG